MLENKKQEQNMLTTFSISDFYQLLSLSLRFPSEELAIAVLDGSYKQDGLNILEELSCDGEDLLQLGVALDKLKETTRNPAQLLSEMRREYTRLFDHPEQPSISIYETTFVNKGNEKPDERILFLSSISSDVERCYQEAGIRLVNESSEPADHMAIELEFMMFLYKNKGRALQEKNTELIKKMEEQIQKFEKDHLTKWGYEFFNSMEAEARNAFYRIVAKLAKIGLQQVLSKH